MRFNELESILGQDFELKGACYQSATMTLLPTQTREVKIPFTGKGGMISIGVRGKCSLCGVPKRKTLT